MIMNDITAVFTFDAICTLIPFVITINIMHNDYYHKDTQANGHCYITIPTVSLGWNHYNYINKLVAHSMQARKFLPQIMSIHH